MYAYLVSGTNIALRWFCDDCEKLIMSKRDKAACHNDKIDHLITVIEKLMERYEKLDKQLENKCETEDVLKLETRISQLEARIQKYEDMDRRLESVEEQLKLKEMAGSNDENAVSDEELIKVMVQEEVNRKSEEERDIESRKRNIIIYRVPEKKTDSVAERKTNDAIFVKDLLDGVFDMKVEDCDVEKMYRLGRWSEDKARPLLVTFRNYEKKEHIMENLRNLRQAVDKFKRIGISNDLHPKEREEIKLMIEEAKQEYIAGGGENAENYRFIVVGKGQKRKVIRVQRNRSSA